MRWFANPQLLLQLPHQCINICRLLRQTELPLGVVIRMAGYLHRGPMIEQQARGAKQQAKSGTPDTQPGMDAAQPFENDRPMPARRNKQMPAAGLCRAR